MTSDEHNADQTSAGPAAQVTGVALLWRNRPWPWRRIAIATLVAASADAAFAFIVYVLVARRLNFETLLQYIASGVLGDSAFASGWIGVGYAALGFIIHLVLAAVFVVAYWLAIAPLVRTVKIAVCVGLVYGAGIWLFMNIVVLPLGKAAREGFFNVYFIAFLVGHAALIGLPIALILLGAGPVASREQYSLRRISNDEPK